MSISQSRAIVLAAVIMLCVGLFAPRAAAAQTGPLCFDVPGITNCIQGRFLQYWRDNGGLPVFGYPVTAEFREETPEGVFTVQYFERNVFEYHPEQARPYDVLLGRLGDTRLLQLGRDWFAEPKGTPTAGCSWWAQTSHSICGEFKAYWESHGLNDPALDRTGRSLQLFGLPLTEPMMETNGAGDTVMTQWFERARLEFHSGKGILLGLLGNETLSDDAPPEEDAACADIPAAVNAFIDPNCVKIGEEIYVEVFSFKPNEEVSYWVTLQGGATIGGVATITVDETGSFGGYISTAEWGLPPGNYVFVAQDSSGARPPATAPFRVL